MGKPTSRQFRFHAPSHVRVDALHRLQKQARANMTFATWTCVEGAWNCHGAIHHVKSTTCDSPVVTLEVS